jgi:hypothetical protein
MRLRSCSPVNRQQVCGHRLTSCSGLAAVAQSVEQRIRNAKVTSSIPVSGTKIQQQYQGVTSDERVTLFYFQLHWISLIRACNIEKQQLPVLPLEDRQAAQHG